MARKEEPKIDWGNEALQKAFEEAREAFRRAGITSKLLKRFS